MNRPPMPDPGQIVRLTTGSDSETYAVELLTAEYLSGFGVETETCKEPEKRDAGAKAG